MTPPLNEHGYLPPGVHRATLDDVIARFGSGSVERQAEAQSLQWPIPMCRAAGIVRILINGSFVTSAHAPNDADCVLIAGPSYNPASEAAAALRAGLPFLSLYIASSEDEVDFFASDFFASDRAQAPKGLLEVIV